MQRKRFFAALLSLALLLGCLALPVYAEEGPRAESESEALLEEPIAVPTSEPVATAGFLPGDPLGLTVSYPRGLRFTSYDYDPGLYDVVVNTGRVDADHVTLWYRPLTEEVTTNVMYVDLQQNDNGTFAGRLPYSASYENGMPQKNGYYYIAGLTVWMLDGSSYVYSLEANAYSYELTPEISGGHIELALPTDTTPPSAVEGSLRSSAAGSIVRIGDVVTVEVMAADDVSGVAWGVAYWEYAGGNVEYRIITSLRPVEGTPGLLRGTMEVPASALNGEYTLAMLSLCDRAFNVGYGDVAPALADSSQGTFTVAEAGEVTRPESFEITYERGPVFDSYSVNDNQITLKTDWEQISSAQLRYVNADGFGITAMLSRFSTDEPGLVMGSLHHTYYENGSHAVIAPNGEYELAGMIVFGENGMIFSYGEAYMGTIYPLPQGLPALITLALPEDTTPPVVKPGSLESSVAGRELGPLAWITVNLQAKDDLSGIGNGEAVFVNENGAQLKARLMSSNDTSEYRSMQFNGQVNPYYHANGSYTLQRLTIWDRRQNMAVYEGAALAALLAGPADGTFSIQGTSVTHVATPDDGNLGGLLEDLLEDYDGEETPVLVIDAQESASTVIPQALFGAAAGQDVELRILTTLNNVTLVFNGRDIAAAKAKDVDVSVRLLDNANYSFIPANDATTQVLEFPANGELPGTATLLLPNYSGEQKAMRLYYLDEKAGRYVLEQKGLLPNAQDLYEVPLTHNSTFVFTALDINGEDGGDGGNKGGETDNGGQKKNPNTGI